MTKEITLSQANVLTQARYDFSKVEKRSIYFIIAEVRRQFIDNKNGQKDLFDNLVVKMDTAKVQGSDTDLRDMYTALKSLRRKSIWLEDDERVLEVGYINYFEHKKHSKSLEVEVSKKILPYLVQLAEQFTTYRLTVAISLKNKYSQRFYEYCSQFKSSGFLYMKVDELRHKLMIDEKYPRWVLIKSKVIDPAQKELEKLYNDNECDLYFTYKEDKNGRLVEGIKITIHTREQETSEKLKIDDMVYYVRTWLNNWLNAKARPKNKEWVDRVIKHVQINADLIPELYERLDRMQREERPGSYAALARHIIEDDFLTE